MTACIGTVAFNGIDVEPVEVQVQIANGLPAFNIVGLPDKAVAESKERVRAALHSLGISLPPKRMTINLAPADVVKAGSHYDLAIVTGVLAALEILPANDFQDSVVLGELSLDGSIRSVTGILPTALYAATTNKTLICPQSSRAEAIWAGNVNIIAPAHLLQLVNHMKGSQLLAAPKPLQDDMNEEALTPITDFSQVRGQETAKRALEIAAAGGHNVLMKGPPGSGKSLLASALPGILPDLTPRESLEASMIHSLSGTLPTKGLLTKRPFRDPHHSASQPALVGGGQKAKPGEISLAHNGILFLDELPEFSRQVLESLRQPLETGEILISRANNHVRYPARFQLIAAMNPCHCGYHGDPIQECRCTQHSIKAYQSRLSGPLLDRIDIHIDVPAVDISSFAHTDHNAESSETIKARVEIAKKCQNDRFYSQGSEHHSDNLKTSNAHLTGENLEKHCALGDKEMAMYQNAAKSLKLSARAYHRVLKVSRTIADLSGHDTIQTQDLSEALSYR